MEEGPFRMSRFPPIYSSGWIRDLWMGKSDVGRETFILSSFKTVLDFLFPSHSDLWEGEGSSWLSVPGNTNNKKRKTKKVVFPCMMAGLLLWGPAPLVFLFSSSSFRPHHLQPLQPAMVVCMQQFTPYFSIAYNETRFPM